MILAAGRGERLMPLTENRPKPMLPINGRPALEYIIAWLRHYGITELFVNLSHHPEGVTKHFDDGRAFGVHLTCSIEDRILGTASGVKNVAHLLGDPFVVVYGDVLTDLELSALIRFHETRPAGVHVSLALNHTERPWDCGIVGVDAEGRVTRFAEKPAKDAVFSDLSNSGIMVVDAGIMNRVPEGEFSDFGLDILPQLLDAGVPIHGWLMPKDAYLIDMGTMENYRRAQAEWPTARARAYSLATPRDAQPAARSVERLRF